MDQKYFLISYNGCIHFPMLGLKLLYVSKINPLNWRHVICKCILRRFVSSFKVDCVFFCISSWQQFDIDLCDGFAKRYLKSHFINPRICMCVTMARCDKIWNEILLQSFANFNWQVRLLCIYWLVVSLDEEIPGVIFCYCSIALPQVGVW